MSSVDDRNEPSEWGDSRFRTLAEHASALVLELSQCGALVYVGPSVRDVLGYEPDELQRMGSLDLIHPDDRERTAANYSEVLSGERRAHSVHRARHKDGSWRWMQDVACSFTTERGELRVLVLARDVSDQKRLEQQLERQLAVQGQVADLSRHFLSLPSGSIDEGVERHLSTVAELAGADWVRLVVRKRDDSSHSDCYDWCSPGLSLEAPAHQSDYAERLPWLAARVASGEIVQIPVTEELPDAARRERQEFRRRGVRSALSIPLWFGRTVIGYQVFESARQQRRWSSREVTQLRLVGEIFAGAVQRKHAEETLRESQERFRAIADHAGELVIEVDERGRYVYLSPSIERLLGCAPEALVGQPALERMHPDDVASLSPIFADALAGRSELRVMHRMRHEEGGWRWFESSGRTYQSASGAVRFLSIGRDVTERLAAERAVERQLSVEKRVAALSRRLLALAPEELDDAIREALCESAELADADRSFLCVSGADEEADATWYEWCGDAVQGFEEGARFAWSDELRTEGGVLSCGDLAALGPEAGAEREVMRRRGVESFLVIPVRTDKRSIGMIGFESRQAGRAWSEMDVTLLRLIGEILVSAVQRKRTGLALRESQMQLVHAERLQAVGRLAGGIAHDFNNLLTVILGFSRPLLRELSVDDPVREDVAEIHGAAERAAALTGQLLTFSRRQAVEVQVVDLNAILSGLESLLGRLLGDDIELALQLGNDLVGVKGDPHQFEQVLVNLAANARDAMPDGGTLQISTERRVLDAAEAARIGLAGAGSHVLLEVQDSGHGIDEQTRAQIFDPFFTTKEPGKGTGLGLSIAYGVVQEAGGAIQVETPPGKGTTFQIWLPGAEAAEASDAEDEPAARGSGCVLLVEDEPAVRRLARRILQRHGYSVLEAGDGVEALERARTHPGRIDALISDVLMPRMGGYELARLLREDAPGMALMFVSGDPGERGMEPGDGPPPDSVILQKPFGADALLARLRDALDEHG